MKLRQLGLTILGLNILFSVIFELKQIYSDSNLTLTNNANQSITVLVGKSLKLVDKKYLLSEYSDIQKIENAVSTSKSKPSEPNSLKDDLIINTKRPDGKNSIFVEALQFVKYFKNPYSSFAQKKLNSKIFFPFNTKDRNSDKWIRASSIMEANITCSNEIERLPRIIDKKDKTIKFGPIFTIYSRNNTKKFSDIIY